VIDLGLNDSLVFIVPSLDFAVSVLHLHLYPVKFIKRYFAVKPLPLHSWP